MLVSFGGVSDLLMPKILPWVWGDKYLYQKGVHKALDLIPSATKQH